MKSFGKKLLFSVLALVSGTTVAFSQDETVVKKSYQSMADVYKPSTLVFHSGNVTSSNTSSNQYSLNDFSFWGVSYFADFDGADKGFYMVGGESLADSGWGVDLQLGFNYGLVDKDYAGCLFFVGPAYGYAQNNVLLAVSLDFAGSYRGAGKVAKTETSTMFGGTHTRTETKTKFDWGMALMPKVGVKLGKVTPWLGINAMWMKDSKKLDIGFQIGLGFDI